VASAASSAARRRTRPPAQGTRVPQQARGGSPEGAVALADDESDPPGRVARLSYANGAVSLQPAGVEDWADAVRRHRPRTASLVPAALRMVLDADLDPDPCDLQWARNLVGRIKGFGRVSPVQTREISPPGHRSPTSAGFGPVGHGVLRIVICAGATNWDANAATKRKVPIRIFTPSPPSLYCTTRV